MRGVVLSVGCLAAVVTSAVVGVGLLDGSGRRASFGSTTGATDVIDPEFPGALASGRAEWFVIFDDHFDGDMLGSQWTTCFWWQVNGGCTIASNHELQWYRPEGVRVSDSVLRLDATADPQFTSDGKKLPFRSGMASTGPVTADESAAGFTFTFGYVEALVRLPSGGGTWPAVWLLSADLTSTPEIDIVEHYSNEKIVKHRVHQRLDGEKLSQGIESPLLPTPSGWHRVGVLWTANEVSFYLDDVWTGTVDDERLVPHTPMYIIVNLAMGGRAGEVDKSALPQHFEIDRIRVWQQRDAA